MTTPEASRRSRSWWPGALLRAVPFGTAMGVVRVTDDGSWRGALLTAVVTAVVFAAVTTPLDALDQRRRRRGRTPEEIAALDVLDGAALPQDPAVRAVVRESAQRRLDDQGGWPFAVTVLSLALVVCVVAAVVASPWYLLLAVVFLGLGWSNWRRHQRLRSLASQT